MSLVRGASALLALGLAAPRSLGIDASECDMLFRVNSRMTSGAGGTSLVLEPQMHLACRF